MRRVLLLGSWAVVPILAGCNGDSFSGVDASDDGAAEAEVDAGVDAPGTDASDDAGPTADAAAEASVCQGGAPVTEVATANGDTVIVNGSTQNFGTLAVVNVSEPLNSAGLFRFPASAAAIGALNAGRLISVQFTFTRAVVDQPNCQGTCPAAAGTVKANPLTTSWTETTANWSSPWGSPGAQGTADIGSTTELVTVTATQPTLTATFPGSAFGGWASATALAVRLGPSGGAVFVIATKENANYAKPAVTMTYCP